MILLFLMAGVAPYGARPAARVTFVPVGYEPTVFKRLEGPSDVDARLMAAKEIVNVSVS